MDVQVQIGPGLPAFAIVDLLDKAVAESRERVRGARPRHQSTPGEWLCLGRLHEVEGVAVEDCGVSEGITQLPSLHSDRRIDLQHFLHFSPGVDRAAKANVGDRQEQVSITVFGLRYSIHRLSKSPHY